MKTTCIVIFAFFLVGCTSTHQSATLTPEQAKTIAIQLANNTASTLYKCQPFHDGQPAAFVSGHWVWRELVPGDYEATVQLAADGSTNSVAINILSETAF
jgi:hypothetical protein